MSLGANVHRDLSFYQKLVLGFGFLVVALAVGLWAAPSAAAYSEIPDRSFMFPSSNYNGHSASDVYMVLANQGGGVLLDAPTSRVTFYFDTPNAVITIGNGGGSCSVDSPEAGSNTFYGISDVNNPSFSTIFFSSVDIPSAQRCGTYNVSINGLSPYTIPGTSTTMYVAAFQATLTGSGNINSYRLSTNDGLISYSRNSGNKFALEDRVWQSATATTPTTRFDLPFAPSCDVTGTRQVNLSWFDDDYGTSYQASNISMSLIEYSASGAPTGRVDNYTGSWGGEGVSRNWSVSVTAGRKYIWRWNNISERNGIQFQLPYDSFYYDFRCDQSTPDERPNPRLGADCNEIRFIMDDPDGDHYNIMIVIDGNDVEYRSNQEPNVTHTFDISDRYDLSAHNVTYRFRSYGSAGYTQATVPVPTRSFGPCATVSCSGGPTPLTSPSPGETVRVRQNITTTVGPNGGPALYSAAPNAPGASSVTPIVAGPPGTAGTWNSTGQTIVSGLGPPGNPYGGPDDYMEWDVVWPTAGSYDMSVTFSGSFSLTCNSNGSTSIKVTDKPYLRVWGGDVIVGCSGSIAWGTNTFDASRGRILAFSRENGRGAGGNLVVQAFRTIDQFSSGQRSGRTLDDYLTMANGGSGVNATWGGSFGASQCADDYFSSAPTPSGSFSFPSASGTYSYSGNATIGAQSIPNGRNITIFVNGDVTLNGDITYPGSGSWSSLSQIPSLTIIARNIRIASGVSELSGRFVAQPDGASGGTILTCTSGTDTQAQLVANCRNQLTVYGSFVAKSVKFTRLASTVGTANPGDNPLTSTAAERFIYGPELWLKSTAGSTTGAGSYDAIVAQPPVF